MRTAAVIVAYGFVGIIGVWRSPPAGGAEPTTRPALDERYAAAAKQILDAALAGNDAYRKLEELCDDIGPRLVGSDSHARAVTWAIETLKHDGQENVRAEPVTVPHWIRGEESLELIEPRRAPLFMLGLGGSIGTGPDGITAEVLSVADKDELDARADAARGKIVLFDHPMHPYDPERGAGYGEVAEYRIIGPAWAAAHGAVGCLVRSVTARSLRSPHTGLVYWEDGAKRIPAAAISTEDAGLITRLQKRGIKVKVTLKMAAHEAPPVAAANVVAELRGREKPDELVVLSGHLDSWDVGQGAHDDGGGCVTAMEAIHVLRRLKLTPRRTIRVVLWVNEEYGVSGGRQYVVDHKAELPQHVAAIEMDLGVFAPRGYGVSLPDDAKQAVAEGQVRAIMRLLTPLGPMVVHRGGGGTDIEPMEPAGVPLLGHDVDTATYFDYHHSHADTLDKVDPQLLSQNVAVMAVTAYVLADMPERLGDEPAPTSNEADARVRDGSRGVQSSQPGER